MEEAPRGNWGQEEKRVNQSDRHQEGDNDYGLNVPIAHQVKTIPDILQEIN